MKESTQVNPLSRFHILEYKLRRIDVSPIPPKHPVTNRLALLDSFIPKYCNNPSHTITHRNSADISIGTRCFLCMPYVNNVETIIPVHLAQTGN